MPSYRCPGSLAAFLFLALTSTAALAEEARVAAVVNDDVISLADLQNRVKLVTLSSGLPADAASMRRVTPQVLRQMIDEKLEMQEAKKHDVKVSPADIDATIKNLAQQNHMPPDGIDKFLKEHGIDRQTLVDQLTAQRVWADSVQGRYHSTVTVGDEEIAEATKEIEEHRNDPQVRLAEIFLSVETPSQDTEVHQFAEKLYDELKKGAPFQQVARQFSQSSTAAVGGDIGWVIPGSLSPELDDVIAKMQRGQLTSPLRLNGGYYIYLMIDERKPEASSAVTMNLTQVVFPMAEDADQKTKDAIIAKARQATDDAHSCGEMAKLGRDISPQLSGSIGDVKAAELPPEVRPMLIAAPIAKPTKPVPVRGGIGVFMVCSRDDPQKLDRDAIADRIMEQRLENLARRYIGDLRRVAYIDVRV